MDTIREATPVSEEVQTQTLYCIKHERVVKAEQGECGLGHVQIEGTGEDATLDFCCFDLGYTYCPPPAEIAEPSDDWASQPDILSDDERATAEVEEMGIWSGGME